MNYHAGDCYDREEVFIEALHQGVIFSALGKFNHRTPKQHHIHLYQKPSIISSAKLDLSMRWNDSRTVNFEKTKGYEDRETVDELFDERFGKFPTEIFEIFKTSQTLAHGKHVEFVDLYMDASRSRQEFCNEYLIVAIGFDTAII